MLASLAASAAVPRSPSCSLPALPDAPTPALLACLMRIVGGSTWVEISTMTELYSRHIARGQYAGNSCRKPPVVTAVIWYMSRNHRASRDQDMAGVQNHYGSAIACLLRRTSFQTRKGKWVIAQRTVPYLGAHRAQPGPGGRVAGGDGEVVGAVVVTPQAAAAERE